MIDANGIHECHLLQSLAVLFSWYYLVPDLFVRSVIQVVLGSFASNLSFY